ncbi:MAG: glycosyltransferase family 2 protein [Chitinophagaceae bacterium]|nr:glycosyltransferase family 2 protein [Chitinophagaceae bacterium]MCB9046930.1 glycosyltransferase family 2 protein [Chitinophagales bacterium]
METADTPLISILMTAYNRGKFIAEAIESVLNSTYQNFELIIVDDVSKDDTYKIASSYAEKDKRISVYRNEENLGDYPNRNRAASYAKGEYLKYLDADDKLYPYGLEIMLKNMAQFPESSWGLMSIVQDDDRQFPILLSPHDIYARHFFNTNPCVNQPHIFHKAPLSAIIKRSSFEDVGGFKHVRHYGDSDLWQRLARKHSMVLMQDGLVWWRGGDSTQESSKRKSKPELPVITNNNYIENLIHEDCPLNREERALAIAQCRNRIKKNILIHVKKGNISTAMKLSKLYKEIDAAKKVGL